LNPDQLNYALYKLGDVDDALAAIRQHISKLDEQCEPREDRTLVSWARRSQPSL
jgi:hypothetical protein